MNLLSDTHDKTGTMVILNVPAEALADLAERVTQGDLDGRDLYLCIEIEPGMVHNGVLKAKVGGGTWTPPMTRVGIESHPLFDA